MDFFGEIQHAFVSGQGFFSFMVVVAKSQSEFEGDGSFFHAANK
jgi:hypothetical protein